jgi:hypothetical protein
MKKNFVKHQGGFVPLLIMLLLVLAAAIVLIYLRVAHARAGV